jgi:hypothetical protein
MSNETLNITLSAGGIVVGVVVSWVLFRHQQRVDFSKLLESITGVAHNVSTLSNGQSLERSIDILKNLERLRASIETLSTGVETVKVTIIGEIRHQQNRLMKSVQDEFDRHIERSRGVLESSIEKELRRLLPRSPERDAVITTLADLVKHAMLGMGKFQRENIETQSVTMLEKTGGTVAGEIKKVKNNVKQVERQLQPLSEVLLLPGAKG